MEKIQIQYVKTIVGEIIIGSYNDKLCLLDYRYRRMRTTIDKRIQKHLGTTYEEVDNPLLQETRKQLDEYFKSERKQFELPLLQIGTEFQKSVWDALLKIPYGTTSTYLDLAKQIDNDKAVRAVANANGANCIGIIIPCHRIIGSDGSLVGFAGGLPTKKRLLKLEGAI